MNKCLPALFLACVAGMAHAAPDRSAMPLSTPTGAGGIGAPVASVAPTWQQLSPEQRRQRRADYAAWRAMSEAERQRVRQAAERFAALPPAKQQELRDSFNAQDRAFRDGWRLGPLLGEHFGRLQGMFGYVPEDQRQATLVALRQLTPSQVAQLTLVAQRTPPQQRDAVRTEFLSVAPSQRDAWLTRQVGR